MKSPSDYSPIAFNGLHFMVVDAGTVVADERSGEEVTVSDQMAVRKGATVFCTQRAFDSVKRQIN